MLRFLAALTLSFCLSRSVYLSLCLYLCFSLFLSLHGALTKRPLFILFCQQPKRRGECPPKMPLSKAHSLRDIHASRSRKLTISVLLILPFVPLSVSQPKRPSPTIFPFSSFFVSLIFRSRHVSLDRGAAHGSTNSRSHETNGISLRRGCLLRFRSVGSRRDIPCTSRKDRLD